MLFKSFKSLSLASFLLAVPAFATANPTSLIFSKDRRPVDGVLNEVIFSQDANGHYTVSFRLAGYNRVEGKPFEEVRVLGRDLKCSFTEELVSCSRDRRPVDGVLVEVKATRNNDNTDYTVTQRTAGYNRVRNEPFDHTVTFATDLEKNH